MEAAFNADPAMEAAFAQASNADMQAAFDDAAGSRAKSLVSCSFPEVLGPPGTHLASNARTSIFYGMKKQSPNSRHLVLHGDTLSGQYFCAVLRVRNVSAFSIQLYWRASPRAGSFINRRKKRESNLPVMHILGHISNPERRILLSSERAALGHALVRGGPLCSAVRERGPVDGKMLYGPRKE